MKTKFTYSSCVVFGTMPLVCPLCRVTVPPNTRHECSKKEQPPKKVKK